MIFGANGSGKTTIGRMLAHSLNYKHIDAEDYLERTFPTKNIRFISIYDNLDSVKYPNRMNSIEVPFINLLNEAYSRDISNKTKASLNSKRKLGKYVGAKAPYGYIKDPNDVGHLLVDNNVSGNIVNIFKWYLHGIGVFEIVSKLNNSNIDTPQSYRLKLKGKASKADKWNRHKIRKILECDIYTGDMVQGKTSAYSHKVKKRIPVPKDEWIVVEDMHEPIIPRVTFDTAQEL